MTENVISEIKRRTAKYNEQLVESYLKSKYRHEFDYTT